MAKKKSCCTPCRPYKRRRRYMTRPRGFPASRYGIQFVPRTAETYNMYGPTRRSANMEQWQNRVNDNYYGRGKYGIRRTIGGFLKKNKTGQMLYDKALGAVQGSGIYTGGGIYTGRGSYDVVTNDLISGEPSSSIPTFTSADDETGALTLTHNEYIRDIYGNELPSGAAYPLDFVNQSLPINPGMEKTFPWLSQIAQNFEEYEFQQLIFTYKSTIAEVVSNNGQVGQVVMVVNYNAGDPPYRDKQTMMGTGHRVTGKTLDTLQCGVEMDPEKVSGSKGKYVRSQGLDPHEDIKTYDHGTMQIGISNTPVALNNATIGELWVSYTVVLRKPKPFVKDGYGISRDIFRAAWPLGDTSYALSYDATLTATYKTIFNSLPALRGMHNSIGCDISPLMVVQTPGVSTRHGIHLTFPGWYAGNIEIRINVRSATNLLPTDTDPIGLEALYGNVKKVYDLINIGGSNASGTPPVMDTGGNPNGISWEMWSTDKNSLIWIGHLRVDIASNAQDNEFNVQLMTSTQTTPITIAGITVDVFEYNQSFGSQSNPVPVFIDSNKNIVSLTQTFA